MTRTQPLPCGEPGCRPLSHRTRHLIAQPLAESAFENVPLSFRLARDADA